MILRRYCGLLSSVVCGMMKTSVHPSVERTRVKEKTGRPLSPATLSHSAQSLFVALKLSITILWQLCAIICVRSWDEILAPFGRIFFFFLPSGNHFWYNVRQFYIEKLWPALSLWVNHYLCSVQPGMRKSMQVGHFFVFLKMCLLFFSLNFHSHLGIRLRVVPFVQSEEHRFRDMRFKWAVLKKEKCR